MTHWTHAPTQVSWFIVFFTCGSVAVKCLYVNSTFWINWPIFIKLLKCHISVSSPVLESTVAWQQWWLLLGCIWKFAMIIFLREEPGLSSRCNDKATGWRRRNRLSADCGSRFVSRSVQTTLRALQWVVVGRAAEERSWQHLHQVPRWRIYGAMLPRPYMSS
jgi:hypothetical protein